MATDLGMVGVWSGRLQSWTSTEATALVEEWQDLGYGTLWVPESPMAKDVLTFAAVLLSVSRSLVIATGIAVIWNRDPTTMMNAGRTLAEAYPGRFVLGVGVSHRNSVEGRGHRYGKPLDAMRSYLQKMDEAPYAGVLPAQPAPRVVAALGPRMTGLAGEMADGIHPFLTTPAHTSAVREALGPDSLIAVEQAVLLSRNEDLARSAARSNLERYLGWPNYRRHLVRIGFPEFELTNGGSDRLVDALYAYGDEAAIETRVAEHHEAGADHVCIQVIPVGEMSEAEVLRRMAPVIL